MDASGRVVVVSPTPRLDAVIDHVAVAVRDRDRAMRRWADELGGAQISGAERDGFHAAQVRYRNGTKLEVISEGSQPTFVGPFLKRYGATVHHVTLKVDDVAEAAARLARADVHVVDLDLSRDEWQEAFLSPRVTGGPVVQLAATAFTDEEWTARHGRVADAPREDGAELFGVVLGHLDPTRGARLWRLLGADVEEDGSGALRCVWGPGRLEVWLRQACQPSPIGLWFRGAAPRPPDCGTGPALLSDPCAEPGPGAGGR